MVRKFVGNIFLIVLINLLIKPFWLLGIDRTVQNTLGTEQYGIYYALLNFSLLLTIVLDLGINSYNSSQIAKHRQLLTKSFSGILPVKLLLAFIYSILTIGWGVIQGFNSYEMYLLLVLSVNQILSFLISYMRSNLTGLHQFKTDAILSVLDKIFMIGICGYLLWGSTSVSFSIETYIYAQTVSFAVTLLIAFLLVYQHLGYLQFRWKISLIRAVLRKSFPYALLAFLMTFYTRIDSVMLKSMLDKGAYQTGVYASAFRLLDAATMLGVLVAGQLLPIFSRMIKEKASPERLIQISISGIGVLALIFCLGSAWFSRDIMLLLYPDSTAFAARVFKLLIFTFLPFSLIYIYGTLLTANENLRLLNRIALIGLVVNIGLNLWLIPHQQAFGAALASLITQAGVAASHFIFAHKKLQLHFQWNLWLRMGLLSLLFIALLYWSEYWEWSWITRLAICSTTALIFSFAIQIFNISDLRKALKNGAV